VPTPSNRPLPLAGDIEPEPDGSHLPRLWNRMLDDLRYAAGEVPAATSRLAVALPDDLGLHERFTDMLLAGPHATHLRAAANEHHVAADIARLASPTVFIGRQDDPRFGDLDRLPLPLPAACSVERIPPQTPAWRTTVLTLLQHASLPAARWRAPPQAASDDRSGHQQRYVDQVHGQIRVRTLGVDRGVPLLVLHDVPGGSACLLPVAEVMARDRLVIAPDLPGLGESHPLPYPSLGSYVTALVELLDHQGHRSVDVFAAGLSGCFAVALAAREAGLVRRVALDGLPMVRSRDRKLYARKYCPPVVPDRHGAYLQQAWCQLRSQEASWPWFDRSAVAARRHDPDLDPHRLQSLLVDVLRQLPSYGDAARAALEGAVREILGGVRQPVLLFEAGDDVLYAGTRRAARRLSSARVVSRPANLADRADVLRQFFD
jgi:pimeloyl-ACP methyl ester carboxylesterase